MKRFTLLTVLCLFMGGCCGLGYVCHEIGLVKGGDEPQAKVAGTKAKAGNQQSELAKLADTKKVGNAIEVNLKGDLLFDRGSDKLTDAALQKIAGIAKVLAKDPNSKIHVTGYTDSRGDAAKNLKLSEWRAVAVKNALSENGVSVKRLTVEGKGSADPVASNDTADGRAANRRAVIRISQ